jgi:hypothetical protein
MLLTDPAVPYWSCVVAVLATLAVLMLWNRVRGPVFVRGLSRVGLLLGGYVATTVAVLVSVNIAYGGLVVSVDDLFADINPPMGQYMHHHTQCGQDGGPSQATVSAAAAAADAAAVVGGGAGGARPWGAPCPQSSSSAAAVVGGAQAATEPSAPPQVQQ